MFTLQDILEMLSDANMYYASEKLGRRATPVEAVFHFIHHRPTPPNVYTFTVEGDEYGDQGATPKSGSD